MIGRLLLISLIVVLLCFVSGVPMTENRRKTDPAYQRYTARTSMLVPLPPRRAADSKHK
jgi:steroid 5-alpha reductase family enzyme